MKSLRPSGTTTWLGALGAIGTAALVAACGGGGGDGGQTGTLRMAITDAPACGYEHVWVTVQKVRVHTSSTASDADGGWSEVVLAQPKRIDLLSLTNGVLEELGQTTLPAGAYSQVRLVLADDSGDPLANALQVTGGTPQPLATPSSLQSGLKLKANFTVEGNQMADLVLDFDACRSIVPRGNSGQYNLKPVVSVFKRLTAGIEGYVATSMPLASTTVSVQQNGSTVRATAPDSTGRFLVPFLSDGSYDVVVTADGFSTAVVSGVPVSTTVGKTVLNGTSTAIVTPLSAMKDVTGTVTSSTGSGTATVVTPVTDAQVRALQALTGGPTVELARVPVDSVLGSYSVRLPVAAPLKATYSNTSTFTLTPDATAAGKVTLEAAAPGRAPISSSLLTLGTLATPVDFSFAP